jgi:alpha-L-arabinofuranosidase
MLKPLLTSCFTLSFAASTLLAAMPDSAYIFAYSTEKNRGKNGLHFAWSIDRNSWHDVGNEHSFLRCDYGTWGSEKRMLMPVLRQDTAGLWRCTWSVNERDSVTASASSHDLLSWTVQAFAPAKNAADADVLSLRDTAHINGSKQLGTVNKVAWSVVDRLVQAQQLSAYRANLWGEQAKDDATRFADLKPLQATLTIDTTHTKKISDMLVGVFFEDINYAADGGLYAELVQNRDFEYCIGDKKAADKAWDARKAWSKSAADGVFAIDSALPIHPNNRHYAVLQNTGLLNEGYDGVAIKAGERYNFSAFARSDDGKKAGKIRVRLLGKGGEIYGEALTQSPSSRWTRCAATLTATASAADAQLEVTPLSDGKTALDMLSLFPQKTFNNRPNGLRADLAQTIADIKPRFVRFPGGCVAHGDGIGNIYRWENTIGALETRKPQRNLWGYHQTAGLGYLEYFQFCEDIGAEPLPVVAAGVPCQNSSNGGAGQQGGIPMDEMDEYVQSILNLVEWANGDKNTVWGRKRADAGHPEPFHLKYLGVGNEDLISDIFEQRFAMIFAAIKKHHPSITVIGTVGPFYEGADYTEGWKFADQQGVPMVDEHYYNPPAWFIYNQDFYDRYDRAKAKVYLGEYAAHLPNRPNNLETALAEALYLTALERNGDVVSMASYAPLLAKEKRTQWNPNLIYFSNTEVKPTVGYHVQKMFGNHAGDTYITSHLSLATRHPKAAQRVACSVVSSEARGEIIIKLVNILPVDVQLDVSTDLPLAPQAESLTLQGLPEEKNLLPEAKNIGIGELKTLHLPAYSFTIITAKLKP